MLLPEALKPSHGRRLRRQAGSSLIEVMVVLVVFAVGILGVAQIFPGGFKILANTQDLSIANALGRDRGEALRAHSQQLPDMILPVSNTGVVDPTRFASDSSIYDESAVGFVLNPDGSFVDGGITYSNYAYYSGPNVFRRIVGEGEIIPAPRTVGNYFGGPMVLQFGPTRQLSATETSTATVYGNDYEVQVGAPPVNIVPNGQAYISNPNDPAGTLTFTVDNPNVNPTYQLSCSIFTSVAGTIFRRDITDLQISVTPQLPPTNFRSVQLSTLAPAGEVFVGIDPNSVRLERLFQQIAPGAVFDTLDPYQYKMLNLHLGVILFSPVGYNYYILRSTGQREPLRGRVDYETQDWRIISDEFRLDDSEVDYKLSLGSLKVLGNKYADSLNYQGIGVQTMLPSGALANTDVLFQDVETGGLLMYDSSNPTTAANGNTLNDISIDPTKSSFFVDKSTGSFRVVDNQAGTPGNQVLLALPDPTQASGFAAPIPVNANGRTVRVMYMARKEWAVQPLVAPSFYYEVPKPISPQILGAGNYFVGTGTRIYFPNMDVGRKVSIDLAYYVSGGAAVNALENQSYVVRNVPADPSGYAYIDITEADGTATAFDFSHGFAVRGVRGNSVTVKVFDNPGTFNMAGTVISGVDAFDGYRRQFRTVTTETFVSRGSN